MTATPFTICIIGAGPRAISILDWLSRRRADMPGMRPLNAILIDPFRPGGKVWQAEQPIELLMNTLAGETTAFADDSVEPGCMGPTLYEWTRSPAAIEALPAALAAAARVLRPNGYAPRALFGCYLRWAFDTIAARFGSDDRVTWIGERAVKVEDADRHVAVETETGRRLTVDRLVLAPGHVDVRLSAEQQSLRDAAAAFDGIYAPPSHPLDAPLDQIRAGENVLIRGLALNFFDAVAMLTEGRGGQYAQSGSELEYRASGNEPQLFVGSRRGVASYARVDAPGITAPIRFVDDTFIVAMTARKSELDFVRDIWPAIVREVSWAYFAALATQIPEAVPNPEKLLEAIRSTPVDSDAWVRMIESSIPNAAHRLDLPALARPLDGLSFLDMEELREWMLAHLQADHRSAADPSASARAVVAGTLRAIRGRIAELMSSGAVGAASFQDDVMRWFSPLAGTIANGPPPERIAQLAALVRAKVVTFLGESMAIEVQEDRFIATSASVPGVQVPARVVLDCFVQRQDIRTTTDPLLSQLRDRGALRPHRRPDANGTDLEIGAIDVASPSAQLICADGSVHPAVHVSGIPLEGVRWNTPLAGRIGVNSEFFRDTRAIADALHQAAIVSHTDFPTADAARKEHA